jgi:hypothetical protein
MRIKQDVILVQHHPQGTFSAVHWGALLQYNSPVMKQDLQGGTSRAVQVLLTMTVNVIKKTCLVPARVWASPTNSHLLTRDNGFRVRCVLQRGGFLPEAVLRAHLLQKLHKELVP